MNPNIRMCRMELDWYYVNLRKYLFTGDIVLFNGKGLLSDIIGFLTGSVMSHIGIIVRTSYEVQILEADWGKAVHGVQLTPLGEKIRGYKGEVFVRFLNCERTPQWYQTLYEFIEKHRGTSYEKGLGGILELLGAMLRINRQNEHNLFCSEMAAGIFKAWGYLPADIASNNYQPKDFEPGKKVDVLLRSASIVFGTASGGGKDIRLGPIQKIIK